MTPPQSPSRSEQEDDLIVVDSEPRYSGPDPNTLQTEARRPSAISAETPRFDEFGVMEVDQTPAPTPAPQPPLRVLEDETVRLQPAGLRLTDFDVRGTLGPSKLQLIGIQSAQYMLYNRYRDFWQSPTSSAPNSSRPVGYPKSLRHEDPSQSRNRAPSTG